MLSVLRRNSLRFKQFFIARSVCDEKVEQRYFTRGVGAGRECKRILDNIGTGESGLLALMLAQRTDDNVLLTPWNWMPGLPCKRGKRCHFLLAASNNSAY